MNFALSNKRVLVTGAHGFVGRNLLPHLSNRGCQLITPTRKDYDLMEQDQVRALFRETKPQVVFHLAAYVGGILANRDYPADFCYRNLALVTLPIHEAWLAGVEKFVGLMGGCSYPATAPSPIKEESLWEGYPQSESAPYSLAKAMGSELAKAYRRQHGFDAITLVPGNIYGPWDNFDLSASHVIPALIRKYIEARESGTPRITAWGSGAPKRDFVYIDDVCRGVLKATEEFSGDEIINISSGRRVTIRELVDLVASLTGFKGEILWDSTKPDGQMDKGFDVTRMKSLLRFECCTPLDTGLRKTIEWFTENRAVALRK